MEPQSEVICRPLNPDELLLVADIHLLSFPDSALTKLGREAVRRYYLWQLAGPHQSYTIGAFKDDILLGYCFGGVFHGALSGFLDKNRRFLALRIITRPWLIFNSLFIDRLKIAIRSLSLLYKKKSKNRIPKNPSNPSFGILSIAVDPTSQKRGVGKILMDSMECAAREHGFSKMNLTVNPKNQNAIQFYEKLGWRRRITSGETWNGAMEKQLNSD